jgi:hypothetical protein
MPGARRQRPTISHHPIAPRTDANSGVSADSSGRESAIGSLHKSEISHNNTVCKEVCNDHSSTPRVFATTRVRNRSIQALYVPSTNPQPPSRSRIHHLTYSLESVRETLYPDYSALRAASPTLDRRLVEPLPQPYTVGTGDIERMYADFRTSVRRNPVSAVVSEFAFNGAVYADFFYLRTIGCRSGGSYRRCISRLPAVQGSYRPIVDVSVPCWYSRWQPQ